MRELLKDTALGPANEEDPLAKIFGEPMDEIGFNGAGVPAFMTIEIRRYCVERWVGDDLIFFRRRPPARPLCRMPRKPYKGPSARKRRAWKRQLERRARRIERIHRKH